ncbi:MAG: 16S rRNA (cytidine(1402)-2'-O)-methyltransferase [Propionibacteriaceae bacterium]|jgi:16S rRNA (cytidine1402-2'-O)-methyltransferase|nr:16S rRNA (cytidine(1402)-2'-O)-methyltransferase [Propionibacteriaceae bacterium]
MTTVSDGILVLAGTPIGDARSASPALIAALESADLIAAEDTRRLHDLCRRIGAHPSARLVSYFDGNETERTDGLVAALKEGARVVLVTDAGMPSVSDPGYRLTRAAVDAGIRVTAVPGPSAVLAALAVSALPVDRFCFEGFPPRKPGARRARLDSLADEERTLVFFEAPHRLGAFLTDAAAAFGGDRPGAVCRELTKTHEEVIRGSLSELVAWAAGEVRGEITVVIGGAEGPSADPAALTRRVLDLIDEGESLKRAVATVAARHRADKRALYDAVVAARKDAGTAT